MRLFASSICLIVASGPCAMLSPIVDNAPAAQVPVLLSVSAPGSPPVPVQPTMLPEPTYYVLPEAPMIDLTAPWPSSLEVSIDGEMVERTEDQARMQELAGQGKGYYRQLSTEPEGQTFRWKLV